MAIAFVSSVNFENSASGATTVAVDTTGATLLVIATGSYSGGSDPPTISDNKGNTWNLIRKVVGSGESVLRVYYSVPTSVGSGHTFNSDQTAMYGSLLMMAFSGTHASAPLDQSSSSSGSGTSGQAGSITPTQDNELCISCFSGDPGTHTYSIDESYSDTFLGSAGYERCAIAYKVQTTATATNPTRSWTGSYPYEISLDSFKEAAAGGATVYHNLMLLGVGG